MNSEFGFSIPAYGESPYLAQCIESLRAQTIKCELVITTSTPNSHINSIAAQYGIRLIINSNRESIASDWNFALATCQGKFVCLAHQDDLYHPEFAERMTAFFSENSESCLAFSDSMEIFEAKSAKNNKRELVKRLIRRLAFMGAMSIEGQFRKKILLGLGCPIPCPSVVFNKSIIENFEFSNRYTINLDWDAWARFAREGGRIGYVRGELIKHRIHCNSETQNGLQDERRHREDYIMFQRYWPLPVARLLLFFYRASY